MKLFTVGATALLMLSSVVGAESPEPGGGSVQIIEGDRVDIYEHYNKSGRSRVDVAPKSTKPYSFVDGEIGDTGSQPAGNSPDAPTQMWSIKKW